MMVRRSAFLLVGIATLASFAAGWWAGAIAKPHAIERQVPALVPSPTVTLPANLETAAPNDETYSKTIAPFVKKYCLDCHNSDKAAGGLTLEGYMTENQARRGRKDWLAVQEILA
ncbi:MAG TPA: hypothetical protein VN641_18010, partial [Urbifossiella sp.]|nr:hypothetical protein [Urbifossiella sp.]